MWESCLGSLRCWTSFVKYEWMDSGRDEKQAWLLKKCLCQESIVLLLSR